MEIRVVWMAVRPQTARSLEFEEVALRLSNRHAAARRQRDAMQLTDDRILGETQAAADFGGRQPFLEQLRQPLDALGRPGDDIHDFPRILWTPRSTPTTSGTTLVTGCQPISISCCTPPSGCAPVAQHLREIRRHALVRSKARAPQAVEILAQVAGVVGFVKSDREVVEHRVVIGLVAGL